MAADRLLRSAGERPAGACADRSSSFCSAWRARAQMRRVSSR